eukprot:TRINITY_DN6856_c1_g1_i3.p1 TRINITY_DN6856_c1_g1~~TRINITY_DN6856_c1_g1_i3.p1  ORF type:complete len:339 (+),score=67.69 TRINITY_DN6856_c1_g1_i3:34-1017(+)
MGGPLRVLLSLLLALCVSALVHGAAPLPPYKQAGSVLSIFDGELSPSLSRMWVILWDAATGQNYTTTVGDNLFYVQFNFNYFERLAPFVFSNGSLIMMKYAPKQAPMFLGVSCKFSNSVYIQYLSPFVMNGKVYVLYQSSLHLVDTSTCNMTAIHDLPYTFDPQTTDPSIIPNHVVYIQYDQQTFNIVTISFTSDTVVTIQTQSFNPKINDTNLHATIQEDVATANFYVSISGSNTNTVWQGEVSRHAIIWRQLNAYTNDNDNYNVFSLDTRQEEDYSGPLICVAEFVVSCTTLTTNTTVFTSPTLKTATPQVNGIGTIPVYDPNCY